MYLSKKQEMALDLALDAIDCFWSGQKSKDEQEAFDTISEMLRSSMEEKEKRMRRSIWKKEKL